MIIPLASSSVYINSSRVAGFVFDEFLLEGRTEGQMPGQEPVSERFLKNEGTNVVVN